MILFFSGQCVTSKQKYFFWLTEYSGARVPAGVFFHHVRSEGKSGIAEKVTAKVAGDDEHVAFYPGLACPSKPITPSLVFRFCRAIVRQFHKFEILAREMLFETLPLFW
jgi:hypothetical protein